jgi:hypothetical protein
MQGRCVAKVALLTDPTSFDLTAECAHVGNSVFGTVIY